MMSRRVKPPDRRLRLFYKDLVKKTAVGSPTRKWDARKRSHGYGYSLPEMWAHNADSNGSTGVFLGCSGYGLKPKEMHRDS